MNNFENNIDKMVSKILAEEIEKKSKQISEQLEEELSTGQKKIAKQAEPKDKITGADFKKLRDAKKHKEEVEEWFFFDDEEEDESTPGDYEGDEDAEDEAEELSAKEPTYVGKGLRKPKMIGSFDDEHGWFDEHDRQRHPDDMEDFEEEEFSDLDSLLARHGQNQRWFGKGDGLRMFNAYRDKFGGKPFRVRLAKGLEEEAETDEGNAFSGALAQAKESGDDSFEVDGHKYPVKEAKSDKKWIQKTDMKKGALHKKLNVPEDKKIPKTLLNKLKKELIAKGEGDKKLSAADSKLLKQVNLALTLKSVKENRNVLSLTENELIDMIEDLVLEQQVKDAAEKNNISKKEATGLKKTEKILGKNKSEGDSYFKELAKKMTDYLKDGTKAKYEMNPENFPESNYKIDKDAKVMKYNPSEAVEEYIDAFSYPGMTNLVYDEIKPDDERIHKQLKGDSTFGNAVTDKEGKALGNVVPSEVGERFKKNYDENLYGAEQMKASYKRQPQPVEVEGNGQTKGSLKSKKGADKPSSIAKASKILNTLESTENKAKRLVNEEMNKMKNLIGYNRKTQ
ncbi:MAG: hypothetical protein NTW22_07360 [Proteobacteria bacterium]|nr:hypothetical protein [Pseudomonadota bacterium]